MTTATVIEFPGSSGVKDSVYALEQVLGCEVSVAWHQQETIGKTDLVVIPGGASFGDYLRPGALTKSSPVVGPIRKAARDGVPVLGIGNGFQILCELEVLPGVLLSNLNADFLSGEVCVCVDSVNNRWNADLEEGEVLRLPLSCYFGRYFVDNRTIRDLEENDRIAYRFCDEEGEVDLDDPYNGSLAAIAGICNRHGNVLGMITHPERVVEGNEDSVDGKKVFSSILSKIS